MKNFSRYIGAEKISKDSKNPASRFTGANWVYAAETPREPEYKKKGKMMKRKLSEVVKDAVSEAEEEKKNKKKPGREKKPGKEKKDEKEKDNKMLKGLKIISLLKYLSGGHTVGSPGPVGFSPPPISNYGSSR